MHLDFDFTFLRGFSGMICFVLVLGVLFFLFGLDFVCIFLFEACAFLTFEWEILAARKGSTIR